jgi:hypothetical protein
MRGASAGAASLQAFERFSDSKFARQVEDIAALHSGPQKQAVVIELGKKGQIDALDRSQPSLPRKHGRCATRSRNRQRNGATTLFALRNGLDGSVIARSAVRHRRHRLIRLISGVRRAVWPGVAAALHFERRRHSRDPRDRGRRSPTRHKAPSRTT